MEKFDAEVLRKSLQELPEWKNLAFVTQVAERMLPNYRRFSDETGFGDVSVLRSALDAAWSYVESGSVPNNLDALREACDQQAPDTVQFKSIYTSAALDAANAAAIILDEVERGGDAQPVDVAMLARDTVDLFVQEITNLDPNAPNFEERILRHNLMQRELRRQREDLEALKKLPDDRQSIGRELRVNSSARVFGSLDS